MSSERLFPLDKDTLELFALKGTQVDHPEPQMLNANAVKVWSGIQTHP